MMVRNWLGHERHGGFLLVLSLFSLLISPSWSVLPPPFYRICCVREASCHAMRTFKPPRGGAHMLRNWGTLTIASTNTAAAWRNPLVLQPHSGLHLTPGLAATSQTTPSHNHPAKLLLNCSLKKLLDNNSLALVLWLVVCFSKLLNLGDNFLYSKR